MKEQELIEKIDTLVKAIILDKKNPFEAIRIAEIDLEAMSGKELNIMCFYIVMAQRHKFVVLGFKAGDKMSTEQLRFGMAIWNECSDLYDFERKLLRSNVFTGRMMDKAEKALKDITKDLGELDFTYEYLKEIMKTKTDFADSTIDSIVKEFQHERSTKH